MTQIYQQTITDFDKGPIRRSLFRNGLTLLNHHAIGFSGARVCVNFVAGSMFEKENEYGLAHFLEHLIFKENKDLLLPQIESLGGQVNAYTYKENICFEMSVLGRKLESVYPLFLKMVSKLDVTPEQFEKEKSIVLQELREDMDDHETVGLEYLFKRNFPPELGHPVGGDAKSVAKISFEMVQRYFKKYFRPERMIITVVSGFKHQDLEGLTQKGLEHLNFQNEKKPFRLRKSTSSKKLSHFKLTQKKPIESSIVYFSFNGPSINAKNFYHYAVLDDLLFEGLSSEYFKKFREENAYVYGLGSTLNPFANTGCYIMIFNTQNKFIKPIVHGVIEVLKDMSSKEIDDSRLESIKRRILDNWDAGLDSLDERAELIQDNETYQLTEHSAESLQLKLDEITRKSIQKLCKKLYTEGYSVLKLTSKGN